MQCMSRERSTSAQFGESMQHQCSGSYGRRAITEILHAQCAGLCRDAAMLLELVAHLGRGHRLSQQWLVPIFGACGLQCMANIYTKTLLHSASAYMVCIATCIRLSPK
jgi:hypothetical protein